MCKGTNDTNWNIPRTTTTTTTPRSKTCLLLSSSSFHCSSDEEEHDNKQQDSSRSKNKTIVAPSKSSALLTVACYVLFLTVNEQIIRSIFHLPYVISFAPIILQDERNRLVLARHFSIDAFSCALCAFLGWKSRHFLPSSNILKLSRTNDPPPDIISTLSGTDKDKDHSHCDFHKRLYTYNPYGFQVMLIFFAYQVRNMYDTIIWDDGLLFVVHHILAGACAWFAMYPDSTTTSPQDNNNKTLATTYAIFYFGVSEISTFVLCLLSNFDPDLGVQGLEDVFPLTRIVLASTFVILFLICRMFLWNIITYHYLIDIRLALQRAHPKYETKNVRFNLTFFQISLVSLTLLQFIWMGEIIRMGKSEIEALMMG